MVLKTIRNTLLSLAFTVGAWPMAHAQGVASPMAACTSIDRSDLGQYAWGMALRWGTPALLDQLVRQRCIDPNAWLQLGVDQAPMLDQVRNATMLAKAVSLGWKPVEQVQLDHQRNPFYINPLLKKLAQSTALDEEARAMFRQAQAKYGFTVALNDQPANATEHEDVLIAIASMLPSTMLNEADARTGITPLVAAAAAKYDRLVVALLNDGARWQTTYGPMGARPLRGVWDAAFDGDNCLLKDRNEHDTPLTTVDVLDRQDRIIAALHSRWSPAKIVATSTTVPGLALDMVTAQALWLKPADWSILQAGLDPADVRKANGYAQQIRDLQKSRHRDWDYTTLMGSAVPSAVCDVLRKH